MKLNKKYDDSILKGLTNMNAPQFAQTIANKLSQVKGIQAVALGGSHARGEARPDSDIDLGIYYDPNEPPSIIELSEIATALDDSHANNLITQFGEWGPWINGGGWLKINKQAVDWLYRDITLVSKVITDCEAGITNCYYYPGHPHGFHNHYYLADIFYCHILYDADDRLSHLKEKVKTYPPNLKKALIEKYLWESHFSLQTGLKAVKRKDIFYATGTLFRCAACLIQVLFALNERYINNEKGAIQIADTFALRPNQFKIIISDVLGNPGINENELLSSFKKFELLVEEIKSFTLNT